ncbi:hypothetical protein JHD50_06130 [Sulfurimonas sp. MAG313]|nr:hypothetical protein [Sulfurimonas sp. MAG313]MDF1880888.1 hypothetical protein [Sulfurimonas sp. MAG313]
MVIQATKKLQDFLGIKTDTLPKYDEVFESWHGNIFMIGRKKCLLITHNESLYSIFIYGITKKHIPNLLSIISDFLIEILRRDDFTIPQIEIMLKSLDSLKFTKTSDRSVTGNMNDMVHILKHYNMTEDELDLAKFINHTPYKRGDFHFPEKILKTILDSKQAMLRT